MSTETTAVPRESLTLVEHGLFPIRIHANLTPAALIEQALRKGEGSLTDRGAFTAVTSQSTFSLRLNAARLLMYPSTNP